MKPQEFAVKVAQEAAVLLAGAFLASWILGQMPKARAWMKAQWGGVPGGLG